MELYIYALIVDKIQFKNNSIYLLFQYKLKLDCDDFKMIYKKIVSMCNITSG